MSDHWTQKYVGTPWTKRNNCAWLVRKVLSEEFGKEILVPGALTRRRLSAEEILDLFCSLGEAVEHPGESDGALMRIQGDTVTAEYHIGICSIWQKKIWVLHSIKNIGCLFQPLPHLSRLQLRVVNFYRWT